MVWKHVYQLPIDFIALRETVPARIKFALGDRMLFADDDAVAIVYTARIEAEQFAPHLVDFAVLKLAQHLATSMRVGGTALMQSLYQRAEMALANARTTEVRGSFVRPRRGRWL